MLSVEGVRVRGGAIAARCNVGGARISSMIHCTNGGNAWRVGEGERVVNEREAEANGHDRSLLSR